MALTITPDQPALPVLRPPVAPPQALPLAQRLKHEEAVVVVNGRTFFNWESVFVENVWAQPYPVFRFTSAEETPPGVWRFWPTSAELRDAQKWSAN
jgi:hypothetical protein